MKCSNCNFENPDSAKFCQECGSKLKPQLKACTNSECRDFGKYILPLEAKFCPRCGEKIKGQESSKEGKNTNKVKIEKEKVNITRSKRKKENRTRRQGIKSNNFINGHEYVDLGLPSGLKWATCNVGANSPEEYGDYYAWGEINTKSTYRISNYKFSKGGLLGLFGKCEDLGDISSTRYDVARTNWGGSWRLPKRTELEELINKCTWEWIIQNGKKGYKVTGPNSNSIFIPAAGYREWSSLHNNEEGRYWSSTPDDNDYGLNPDQAYYLIFYNHSKPDYVDSDDRSIGQSVRPVTE